MHANLVLRATQVYSILREHLGMDIHRWLDGFARDLCPEHEIIIWEKIADDYQRREADISDKHKLFAEVFAKSFL